MESELHSKAWFVTYVRCMGKTYIFQGGMQEDGESIKNVLPALVWNDRWFQVKEVGRWVDFDTIMVEPITIV